MERASSKPTPDVGTVEIIFACRVDSGATPRNVAVDANDDQEVGPPQVVRGQPRRALKHRANLERQPREMASAHRRFAS